MVAVNRRRHASAIRDLVTAPVASPLGRWNGLAFLGGDPYDLGLSILPADGSTAVSATLDIPEDEAYGIPLEAVSVAAGHAGFTLPTESRKIRFDAWARGDRLIVSTTLGGHRTGFLMRRTDPSQADPE